ncbi:MAG: hypothetical protein OQL19_06845 [Gammaproteobacteria bacterium]|nr:hypothetical protein [Gammaproteobacteria bacterium]
MKKIIVLLMVVFSFVSCEMYQGSYVSYNIVAKEGESFTGSYVNGVGENIKINGEWFLTIYEFIPYGQMVGLTAKNIISDGITIYIHFKKGSKWVSYKNITGNGSMEIHGILFY